MTDVEFDQVSVEVTGDSRRADAPAAPRPRREKGTDLLALRRAEERLRERESRLRAF
jgi:hypothetical protein